MVLRPGVYYGLSLIVSDDHMMEAGLPTAAFAEHADARSRRCGWAAHPDADVGALTRFIFDLFAVARIAAGARDQRRSPLRKPKSPQPPLKPSLNTPYGQFNARCNRRPRRWIPHRPSSENHSPSVRAAAPHRWRPEVRQGQGRTPPISTPNCASQALRATPPVPQIQHLPQP